MAARRTVRGNTLLGEVIILDHDADPQLSLMDDQFGTHTVPTPCRGPLMDR
jgi:hypothetical protein